MDISEHTSRLPDECKVPYMGIHIATCADTSCVPVFGLSGSCSCTHHRLTYLCVCTSKVIACRKLTLADQARWSTPHDQLTSYHDFAPSGGVTNASKLILQTANTHPLLHKVASSTQSTQTTVADRKVPRDQACFKKLLLVEMHRDSGSHQQPLLDASTGT